ncbi:hypothetical protein [Chromobacterium violaceum]|nr:hypothetical protein [Chromobacterium violaceum]OLZ81241.1 hypothetical protein BS642_08905 [Chromobacterium violaceum]
MEIAQKLKAALSTINGTLAQLKTDLADTNGQIGSINARIAEFKAMPISLGDYSLYLKACINRCAKEHIDHLEFELFRNAPSLGSTPKNKEPFSRFDFENGTAMFPNGMFGGDALSIQAVCFFFGDQIYESFLKHAQGKFGNRWGNEEFPFVEERFQIIADLEAQREELKQKRLQLEAQIDEISGMLSS